MKFIKLHDTDGKEIFVNVSHIVGFASNRNGTTFIRLNSAGIFGDDCYTVKETPEAIMTLIKE